MGAPGPATDFKNTFYDGTVEQLRALQADLKLLLLAIRGIETDAEETEKSDLLQVFHEKRSVELQADLTDTLNTTMRTVMDILSHFEETPVKSENLNKLRGMAGLENLAGMNELRKTLNEYLAKQPNYASEDMAHDMRVRVTVATKALQLVTRHLAEIGSLALSQKVF